MKMPEMKEMDGKIRAKCPCCNSWIDVTALVKSGLVDMTKWTGCSDCEEELMATAYAPRSEERRAGTNFRGEP
jgi:hypothetical protein